MTLALTDYETGYAVGHLLAVIFVFALIVGGLIWALVFLFGRQQPESRRPLPPAMPPDVWPPAPQEKAQKRAADDSKGMP
ncbi:MAG: hypothetical protein M3Y13_05880 [Armatimonadota bacterium]|nr:hypothetical protein [Armatimonadota bacterium]